MSSVDRVQLKWREHFEMTYNRCAPHELLARGTAAARRSGRRINYGSRFVASDVFERETKWKRTALDDTPELQTNGKKTHARK